MDFVIQLFTQDSAAHTALVFGLVIALGLSLGSISFGGIRLGVAGVLFSGLFFGHFNLTVNPVILEFLREFGLILFVYTIGIQVGPGFFDSLKKDGLSLNLLAAATVLASVLLTAAFCLWGGIPFTAAAGIFSGATTNTPSLAAAQQTLKEISGIDPDLLNLPALGYAVSYPFGIVGIILAMMILGRIFRVDPAGEAKRYAEENATAVELNSLDIRVENPNLNGLSVEKIPALRESGVVLSRVLHEGTLQVALPETRIFLGDILRAVGPQEKLENICLIVGSAVRMDLRAVKGQLVVRRVIVTRQEVAGKRVAELHAADYAVAVTRIHRGSIEIPATDEVLVRFADSLTVVGDDASILRFAEGLGNAPKSLEHPQLIPVFTGIALGVFLGSIPFHLPGMPASIKLGLAGGPLLVAILLGRLGKLGRLVWYMPLSANFMLREVGIALFLACVGLRSGDRFLAILTGGSGLYWMAAGAVITLVPLFFAGLYARFFMKLNYLSICGLLAGSLTDPPALAYAGQMAPSSAQSVAYAAVYPLVMILRVVAAQALVLLLAR